MTVIRSLTAFALFATSSTALAGAPVGVVVQNYATGGIHAIEAGIHLPIKMVTVALVFMEEGEIWAVPRDGISTVDGIYQDKGAWSLVYPGGATTAAFQSTYGVYGVVVTHEDGSVETIMHDGIDTLKLMVSNGWAEPKVFSSTVQGTIVSLGEENLLGIVVDNVDGGQDVIMVSMDSDRLEQVFEATLVP